MEKNENEINVLDELNKGACMGRDAIHFILDKVHSEDLKEVLHKQYNKYKEITDKISELYPEYAEGEPHKTNTMNKVMTWYGIEMRTFMDDSDSKLTELLLQGTNMGVIEGRRLLNHKHTDDNVNSLMQAYVDMQEECVEELKKFL